MNFKVIKSKAFDTAGVKGVAYTVALRGRAINVSTLSFEEGEIKPSDDNKTLSISCEVEAVKSPYVNELGETVQGLKLMPKLGIAISDF